MSKKTRKILVFDTETAGNFSAPLVYDIGYCITDRNGNPYLERSFVIKEVFCNKVDMANAFYGWKVPDYIQDIADGKRQLVSFEYAMNVLMADCETYKVKEIAAYNLPFDLKALMSTERNLYGGGYSYLEEFFQKFVHHDLWTTACENLYKKRYCKWCLNNGQVSEKGNVKTSAEVGHRYFNKDVDFVESHTGLEDVHIEMDILVRVYRAGRKFDKAPKPMPWRGVQKYRPD